MNIKTIKWMACLVMALATPQVAAQDPAGLPEQAQPRPEDRDFQVPDSYVDRVRKQGAVLDLTLQEAIRLALTNNLEIAIENYNEDLNREQIIRTKGYYDPSLSFTLGWRSSEFPTTSQLDAGGGIAVRASDTFTFDTSLLQNVVGGGQLRVSFNNNRVESNSAFLFINPTFSSNFNVNFRQPLWRGFQRTNVRRQLQISNLDTEISDAQFKQQVAEIVQQVQNQYWEMVFAVQNFEAQRTSLELAIITHRNNRKRVQIGVLAPIEITSSQAEVARREQQLIQSEVQIINAQNGLKRLLAPDPAHSIWDLSLIPTDRPQLGAVEVTMDKAIETALKTRPELERVRLQMEQNEVNRWYYKRNGKPTLDLVANIGSVGNAGEVLVAPAIDTDGDGVPDDFGEPVPDPTDPRFGAFGNAWNQALGFDFLNWSVAAEITIPLRNRENNADLAMTRIRDRQLLSRMKNQQQAIMVEVRNAYETIATRQKSLEAARLARELAEKQLDGENKRYEAGLSTNFEVLRFQRDLAENQVSELRAEIDYQLALIALKKATYEIIQDNDIVLARGDK